MQYSPNSHELKTFNQYEFISVADQLEFDGVDRNGRICLFDIDTLYKVLVNGIVIAEGLDYTQSTNKITFNTPATTGSVVGIEVFKPFQIADTISKQYAHNTFKEKN